MEYKELRDALIIMLLVAIGMMTVIGGLEFILNGGGEWLWRFLIVYIPGVAILYKVKDLYDKENE